MKNITIFCVSILLSVNLAVADIVDVSAGSLGGMFRDQVTGKLWLDVGNFSGLSFDEIQRRLAGTGFRLATKAEVEILFSTIDKTPDQLDPITGGSSRCTSAVQCLQGVFNDSTTGVTSSLVGRAGIYYVFASTTLSEEVSNDVVDSNVASVFQGAWVIEGTPTLCASPEKNNLDMDCDGKDEKIVWRTSNGTWYVRLSSNGEILIQQWGLSGDVPIMGDYDGDGIPDLAVWRNSNGTWYIKRSVAGFTTILQQQFGLPGDRPIRGDFDADGKLDYAVWRPSNGSLYVKRSSDSVITQEQWGLANDVPVTAGTK